MSDSDSEKESQLVNYRLRKVFHHPKLVDDDRNTKLHYAAAANDIEAVKKYLNKSYSVDPKNYLGWTPLMIACRKGNFDMVKYLLSRKANATLTNKFGMNVFQIAIPSGNLEMLTYLLEYFLTGGISKRILEYKFPVASMAILYRHQDVLEFLIEKHFNIDAKISETGITPFMFAHALEYNQAISLLLKHKVNTTAKNYLGHTALDIATIRQKIKMLYYKSPNHCQESFYMELQNQHLRNVLQLKPCDNITISNNSTERANMQVPCIIVSPFFISSIPNEPNRKYSNVSPFLIPTTPNISSRTSLMGQNQQFFFPPSFSPSQISLDGLSPNYVDLKKCYKVDDFLNSRITSTTGLFFTSPTINNSSPCV